MKINQQDFLELIKTNEPEYEKFCMIKDKIIYNNSYGLVNKCCDICKRYDH